MRRASSTSRSRWPWSAELANPGLSLLGYLITMFNARKSIHKMYEETLRAQYGDDVFATRVPHAAEFPEAIAFRKPIAQYKPKGAAAKAIKALADELQARLDGAPWPDRGGRLNGQARRTATRGRRQRRREHGGRGRPPLAGGGGVGPDRRAPATRTSRRPRTPSRCRSTRSCPTPTSPGRSSRPRTFRTCPIRSGRGDSCSRSASAGTRSGRSTSSWPASGDGGPRSWRASRRSPASSSRAR